MNHSYWLSKWQKKDTAFNQTKVNVHLQNYLSLLNLEVGQRIFVPLCGKSIDMVWLMEQGFYIIGIELSSIAVESFFEENHLKAKVSTVNSFSRYSGNHIEIWCGDFFKLKPEYLGKVTAVYDRAALIALPQDLRKNYVHHLANLLIPGTKILLISIEYDDRNVQGPPYSISTDELYDLFSTDFYIKILHKEQQKPAEHLIKKGIHDLIENVILLTKINGKT